MANKTQILKNDQHSTAIGLFGGTFDPFHCGHLKVATCVYEQLGLKQIYVIPTAQPLLRKAPVASTKHRLAMLECIAADYPWMVIDDREIKRGGFSYTLQTVTALRQEMPDTPLCFLMSIDQFAQFDAWYAWEKIIDKVHVVVTNRAGYSFSPNATIQALLKQRQTHEIKMLHQTLGGLVFFQQIDSPAVSSTDIRTQLNLNPSACPPTLPENIYRYIRQYGLYG